MTISNEDKELNEMFHGEEKPLHPDTVHINLGSNNSLTFGKAVSKKETTTTPKAEKTAQKAASKPRDEEWEPAPHAPTHMEKLKECAKSALCFGGLSLMFFYFQQSGQMAMSAAMPCICACCVLMGLGVGRQIGGKTNA